MEVARQAVLNMPKISKLCEESALELCHYVVRGLTNVFSLGFDRHNEIINLNNLQSAISKPVITKMLLDKQVSEGRVVGLFHEPPHSIMHVNPIGLVPKKKSNELRLIIDLSLSIGSSVNDPIPLSPPFLTPPFSPPIGSMDH